MTYKIGTNLKFDEEGNIKLPIGQAALYLGYAFLAYLALYLLINYL